ncbi:hypothetical protein THAOC_24484, partial [Thalassiosira oceanica]
TKTGVTWRRPARKAMPVDSARQAENSAQVASDGCTFFFVAALFPQVLSLAPRIAPEIAPPAASSLRYFSARKPASEACRFSDVLYLGFAYSRTQSGHVGIVPFFLQWIGAQAKKACESSLPTFFRRNA